MKRFKKLSTTFLTTVLLACNTITSPGFDVWAQEEKIPIDNPSDVDKSIEEPVEETIVPEEPAVEEPVINAPSQNHEVSIPQTTAEEPVEQEQFPSFEKSIDMKDGPTVKVNAPEGAFPQGIQVDIQKIDVDTIYDLLHAQDETIKKEEVIALDFDFYTENLHHIEPKQKISITLQNLDLSKDTKATLYHLPDKNAKPEKKELATFDTNKKLITFESSSFSIYALIVSPTETSETIQPETVVTSEEQPAEEVEEPSSSTDYYDSSINLAPGTSDAYYGGEIITVYDNISVSGNNTVVPEGAYTIVSLPKASFQKPWESEVSTSFDNFKNLEIKETDTDYQIILTYKTLYGGYNGGTPIRVNLLPGQVVNKSQHTITQQFFNKDGKQLTKDSTQIVKAKAEIESIYSNYWSNSRLINEVDSNFVIKEGTFYDFYPGYHSISSNKNDPRDRRLYATIPEGCKVKENTGWTYEPETNRYYKDISRSNFTSYTDRKITLDLGGIDLSNYDASNKAKRFEVDFSVQPVVNGIVQTDLGPYTTYAARSFYILKEPKPTGASLTWSNKKFEKIIDKDYHSIDGSTYESTSDYKYTTISYNKDYLYTHRMRYTLKNIDYWSLSNANTEDEEIRELTIRDSRVDISPYVEPHQIRLMVIGLKDEDAKWMKEQLTGTKAYGITSSGQKVLISDNVPIHIDSSYSNSFDGEDWQTISNTENYTKVEFVYPNGGVTLKGKDQIERCKYAIYSDVIGRVKESTYETLKGYIDAHQPASLAGPFEYGNTSIASKYYKFAEDTELTSKANTRSPSWTYDYIRLQMEKIINYSSLYITNGSQFFTNDTISTQEAYRHSRIGNFSEATQPENLNVYYLVPDGLEPVEDTSEFESIEVVRGYKDGMNLVIARPKSVTIPKLDGTLERGTENWFYLNFTATTRLDIGEYKIYSCMSYDNNKIGVDPNGNQYGILQDSSPSGVWSTILKDANNRPDDNTRFTNFNSSTFKIYPPKVLSAIKEVKLTSEPDSKYASSLGSKATIGDQIDYRWVLKNNSNAPIDQLEILDILPDKGDHAIVHNDAGEYPARGSLFTTPLLSIEDNSKFDYYYSTDPVKQTTQENYKANWSSSVDDWKTSVENLPVNDKNGNPIAYSIQEDAGKNYSSSIRGDMESGFVITNTNTEKRDVSVSKTWIGPKQDSVQVTLVKDGTPTYQTLTLQEANEWKSSFKDLIKYDPTDGHEIVYTVQENEISDYSLQMTGDMDNGFVLTNTNTETLSIPITKSWIGPVQSQAQITLVKDGALTEQTLTLNQENGWKASFDNLAKYDATDGHKIEYTIQEAPVENYTSKITGSMEDGFTVTNTNTETVSIPVEKHWIGPMTDSVDITLVKDEEDTENTLVLNAQNEWKDSFENLPKYDEKDGHLIDYKIKETAVKDYTSKITGDALNGFVVTNTNVHTISIPVQKVWVGPALDSIEVSLLRDEQETGQVLTLTKDQEWKSSFNDLLEFDPSDGHRYVYSLKEADVPGYKSVITGTQDTGFTITNTITGKVSVGITKQWIGKAADSVTVDLMNGDQKVDSVELSASNHWQYTFTDLEQYNENGQPISYTISEVNLDGYVSKITGNMNTGFVITNTNTETVDIPVEKSWIGPEGKQAEVNLYKDGIDQIASLVLSESNQWTSAFTDLPVYDSNDGHKIMYAIKETPIDGYQSEITGDAKSGYRIVNTNIETLSVSVKKQWIGPAQAKATFTLYQDGKKTNQTLVLSKQDQWQGSFTDLAKYDHNDGHAYVYTIEETQLPDYDSKVEGNMKDGFTFTNTNTEAVNVPVEKKWIGPAASKVDILLVKDGIETDRKLTLNEWNHWKGAFNDLTKYDSKDGHEIQYAIKEIPIADYSSDIKQTTDGYVVTNTNMKTRSISVEKRWIGPKADQVMVALYADGKDTGQSLTLSEENEWKAVFDGLSQYDSEDGHEISYSIQEKELPNYTVSIEGDMVSGFVLTNTNVSKRNITVSKKWIGQEGKSATIYLKQDGQRVQTVRLTQECGWQYEFKDLVMYDVKDGHAISYEIEEEEQPGYTSKITGNMEDGFIATNTQITSDSKSKGSTPTGESFDGTSMIVLAITSVVMLIALWIVKRKGL